MYAHRNRASRVPARNIMVRSRALLVGAILGGVVAAGCTPEARTLDVAESLATASRHRRVGDWAQERVTLEEVVRRAPQSRQARLLLMSTYVRLLDAEPEPDSDEAMPDRGLALRSAALDQFEWCMSDPTPITADEIARFQGVSRIMAGNFLPYDEPEEPTAQYVAACAGIRDQMKRVRRCALEWVRRKATFDTYNDLNNDLVEIAVDLFRSPEDWLGLSEQDVYATRLHFIDEVAKANPWFNGFSGFVHEPEGSEYDVDDPDQVDTAYERYLKDLRQRRYGQLPMFAERSGTIVAWDPGTDKQHEWNTESGVELRTDTVSPESTRISLCPYKDRVFIICTQSPAPEVYKTWIGVVAPGMERVNIFFRGDTVPDRNDTWREHGNDISLGFIGGGFLLRTSTDPDRYSVIVERLTGRGRPRPLLIDPETLDVTVGLEYSYTGTLQRQVGDTYVSHWSDHVYYYSMATHKEVGKLSGFRVGSDWFRFQGAIYGLGADFLRIDDNNRTLTTLIKNVRQYSPRIVSLCPSAVYGLFVAGERDRFSAVLHPQPNVPRDPLLLLGDDKTLHAAAQGGHVEALAALLDAGQDVNQRAQTRGGATPRPLHPPASNGQGEAVRPVLELGARLERSRSQKSATPLFLAASNGHEDAVRFLLEHGADIERGERSWSPLHSAVYHRDARVVNVLLEHGADPNRPDSAGQTPLFLAAGTGNVAVLAQLLSHGGDPSVRPPSGYTLLQTAAREGLPEAVAYLRRQGAELDVFTAGVSGTVEELEAFLDKDHSLVNAKDSQGSTLLHWLAHVDDGVRDPVTVANVLLRYGPTIDARNAEGETPLHVASYWGRAGLMRWLVANGADLNAEDADGSTPSDRAREGMHDLSEEEALEALSGPRRRAK